MISAIILAGGRGEGIFPFSIVRNKVILPILNTPIIRRLALQLKEVGIENITVATGYFEQSVRHALQDISGLSFLRSKEGATPADTICSILDTSSSSETIILYGDIVTIQENLSNFIKTHQEQHNEFSILVSNQKPFPLHTIFIEKGTDNKLKHLLFDRQNSEFWFCGVLLGKTKSLKEIFNYEPGIIRSAPLGAMPVPEGNLISAIDLMLERKCEISCIPANSFVVDIDHPWDLIEANQQALSNVFEKMECSIINKSAFISDGADISPNAKLWIHEGGRIEKGTVIKGNLVLGMNSHIGTGALFEENIYVNSNTNISEFAKIHKNSIIGENNKILHNAEFDGITLDTVFMVHTCCVSGVIGSHVDIGAGTISATWRFDDKIKEVRCKQRKEIPPYHGNLTYLGDYCRTGINTMFMPGVRIGAYSCIGPGVIVNNDIDPYSLVILKQQLEIKPWGPNRYP